MMDWDGIGRFDALDIGLTYVLGHKLLWRSGSCRIPTRSLVSSRYMQILSMVYNFNSKFSDHSDLWNTLTSMFRAGLPDAVASTVLQSKGVRSGSVP